MTSYLPGLEEFFQEDEQGFSADFCSLQQKSGDLGEMEFDATCVKLSISPYRPALSNGRIDRLIILPDRQVRKIHVKSSILANANRTNNKKNGTNYQNYFFTFVVRNSIEPADFYYCCGFNERHEKLLDWWIPWERRESHIYIPGSGFGFEEFRRNPFEFYETRN